MKTKIIIITLGLIITLITGIGVNNFKNTANEIDNQNIILSEETNTEDEMLEVKENEIGQKQEEIQQEQPEEQVEVDKVDEKTEIKQEETKQVQQETPKVSSTQPTSTTQKDNENQKTQVTQQTTPVEEEKKETVVNLPKQETEEQKNITPNDLEYWCVSGGSHHIAGDRANEHGYYSSWDEANQAFLNYTKDWSSVQYKISQCSCGLYYFWAIQ